MTVNISIQQMNEMNDFINAYGSFSIAELLDDEDDWKKRAVGRSYLEFLNIPRQIAGSMPLSIQINQIAHQLRHTWNVPLDKAVYKIIKILKKKAFGVPKNVLKDVTIKHLNVKRHGRGLTNEQKKEIVYYRSLIGDRTIGELLNDNNDDIHILGKRMMNFFCN